MTHTMTVLSAASVHFPSKSSDHPRHSWGVISTERSLLYVCITVSTNKWKPLTTMAHTCQVKISYTKVIAVLTVNDGSEKLSPHSAHNSNKTSKLCHSVWWMNLIISAPMQYIQLIFNITAVYWNLHIITTLAWVCTSTECSLFLVIFL